MSENDAAKFRKVLTIISIMAAVLVIAAINRKGQFAFLGNPALGLMRWCDVNVAFVLAPVTLLLLWWLFCVYEGLASRFATCAFVLGAFFFGAGFGMHEPMQAIHHSRMTMSPELANAVAYFDDSLGHWIFFIGFMLLSVAGVYAEIRKPAENVLPHFIFVPSVVIGLVIAVVIFLNMAFEKTGLDLPVLLATVILLSILHFQNGSVSLRRMPVLTCTYIGYGGGAAASIIYSAFSGPAIS